MTRGRWLVTGGCLTCLACGDVPATSRLDVARAGIVDGEASGAEDDGVLLIRSLPDTDNEQMCSASLVAPNLLLTARHCVSYFNDGLFSCSLQGEVIETTPDAGKLGLHVPADTVTVYAGETPRLEPIAYGAHVVSTLSPVICVNDIAFVVLDRELELPLIPMRIGGRALPNETVTLVGYGMDGEQPSIDYETQPRRRKPNLEIVGVGPDLLEDGVTTVAPRHLILDGPSGCVGDSGGPLLAAETGAVLGVYSLQEGSSCSEPSVRHHLTHVPPFRALIDEAFTAAGSEPLPEPGSEPEPGAAGAAGAGPTAEAGSGAGGAAPESPPRTGTPKQSSCSLAVSSNPGGLWVLALGIAGLSRRRRGARLR